MTIDPEDAKKIVQEGIQQSSREELETELAVDQTLHPAEVGYQGSLQLMRPSDVPLPLNAYLACALTGLSDNDRDLMTHLSDMVAVVCANHGVDLYEPRKTTDPVHHADVTSAEVFRIDKKRVLESDLLIHLALFPSTGSGQELDFATSALLPIMTISRSQDRVSRMITGIPTLNVALQYDEPEQLRVQLSECLESIRPILEERKLAFSAYDSSLVGERIRSLREQLGLSREQLANAIVSMGVDEIERMEESTDKVSNPSLIHLRQMAFVLKTTVADLVEPDMGSRVLGFLSEWLEGRQAARYPTISDADTRKIMRRVLLRVVDSLEK